MIDPAFWNGRRVLLTGHTGFKGAWLALILEQLGAEVTGLSLGRVSDPSLFDVADVASSLRHVEGDVRDADLVKRLMQEAHPEVVLHLAAQPLVRLSYTDPVETFSSNVMGTVNVLEAARHAGGVRSMVMVTSDKCYENHEWEWPYREDDELGGADPYSASKAGAEIVVSSYRRSFFTGVGPNVASARAGNVIGGGDWSEARLVPDVLRSAERGEVVTLRNPSALRPWQHVLNPLSGYLLLAQRLYHDPSLATSYNFGPAELVAPSAAEVVDGLCTLWGEGLRWEGDPGPHPHEAGLLRLDSSRALFQLGWRPQWNFDEALRRIVEWHRAYVGEADMRKVTLAQIDDFFAP